MNAVGFDVPFIVKFTFDPSKSSILVDVTLISIGSDTAVFILDFPSSSISIVSSKENSEK